MSSEQRTPEGTITPDLSLNLEGEPCPYPVVYALEVLRSMKPGQLLEIVADCPQSFASVPEETTKQGYRLVCPPVKRGPVIRFYLQVPEANGAR